MVKYVLLKEALGEAWGVGGGGAGVGWCSDTTTHLIGRVIGREY